MAHITTDSAPIGVFVHHGEDANDEWIVSNVPQQAPRQMHMLCMLSESKIGVIYITYQQNYTTLQ